MKEKLRNNTLSGILFVVALSVGSNAFAGGWQKAVNGKWEWATGVFFVSPLPTKPFCSKEATCC